MANGSSENLTQLNAWMRRIDLVTALVGPLFVSLIALAASYPFATAFLLGFSLLSMVFEFVWIGIVFRRYPMLALEEEDRLAALAKTKLETDALNSKLPRSTRIANAIRRIGPAIRQERLDWIEFIHHPIFFSSLSISLLYLTVLSFDGTLLAFLLSHDWSEALLAGLRGLQVVSLVRSCVGFSLISNFADNGIARNGRYADYGEAGRIDADWDSFDRVRTVISSYCGR